MKSDVDELIERLLGDLAVADEKGADVHEIRGFVKKFYDSHEPSKKPSQPSSDELDLLFAKSPPPTTPLVNDQFVAKVWGWLSERPSTITFTAPPPPTGTAPTAKPDDDSPLLPFHNKRIRLTDDSVWRAIAGHGVDHSRIPKLEFQLLRIIASRDSSGMLQPDLLAASGQDKRSLPSRTDRLRDKGYITKVPALGGGQKTSFLRLARYADQVAAPTSDRMKGTADSAGKGKTIFYDDWFQKTVQLLKANGDIMAFEDIRRGLGIQGMRWETRAYLRCIRRLCAAGCLRRLKAQSHYDLNAILPPGAKPGLTRSIQLLRDPTKLDQEAFARGTSNRQKKVGREIVRDVARERAGEEDAEAEIDAEWDDNASEDEGEDLDLDTLDGRVPPQWTPDIPYPNLIYNLIDTAGPNGMTTMELQKRSFGNFFRRPLDELMTRLTEVGEASQPAHLRHLGIIRETDMTGKMSHYTYRTRPNHDKAVELGLALESSLLGLQKKGKGRQKEGGKGKDVNAEADAASTKAPDVDEFGFTIPPAHLFVTPEGDADLASLQGRHAAVIQKDGISHMRRSKDGKPNQYTLATVPAPRNFPANTPRPSTPQGAFVPINDPQSSLTQLKKKPGPKPKMRNGEPVGRTGTIYSRTPDVKGMGEGDFAKNARKIAERMVAAEDARKKRTASEAALSETETPRKTARVVGDGEESVHAGAADGAGLIGLFSSGGLRSETSSPAPMTMPPPPVPKKRGRPRKNPLPEAGVMAPPPVPKKRGRPTKAAIAERQRQEEEAQQHAEEAAGGSESADAGMPASLSGAIDEELPAAMRTSALSQEIVIESGDDAVSETSSPPSKRARLSNIAPIQALGGSSLSQGIVAESADDEMAVEAPAPKKRGRPSKADKAAAKERLREARNSLSNGTLAESDGLATPAVDPAAPKKRGRPTKAMVAERKRQEEAEAARIQNTPGVSEDEDSFAERGRPSGAGTAERERQTDEDEAYVEDPEHSSPSRNFFAAFRDPPTTDTPARLTRGVRNKRGISDAITVSDSAEPEEPQDPNLATSYTDPRIAKLEAELLARSRPGIYINPPGALATKHDNYFQRGRPRRALIAVIKTEQLHQLPWFKEQQVRSRRESTAQSTQRPLTYGRNLNEEGKTRRSKAATGTRAGKGREKSAVLVQDSDEDVVDAIEEDTPEVPAPATEPGMTWETPAGFTPAASTPVGPTTAGDVPEHGQTPTAPETSIAPDGKKRKSQDPGPQAWDRHEGITAPRENDMDAKDVAVAIDTHRGGLIGKRRTDLIIEIIEKCGGIYPGKNEVWFPFVQGWQRYGQDVPDRQTVSKSVTYMVSTKMIRRLSFTFRTGKGGRTQENSILTLNHIDPSDPKIIKLQRNILAHHPNYYLPPETGISMEMQRRGAYQNANTIDFLELLRGPQTQPRSDAKPVSRTGMWKDEYPEIGDAIVKRTPGAPPPPIKKKQIYKAVVYEDSDDTEEDEVPAEQAAYRTDFQIEEYEHKSQSISWREGKKAMGRVPKTLRRKRNAKHAGSRRTWPGEYEGRLVEPYNDEDDMAAIDMDFLNNGFGSVPAILAQSNMAQELQKQRKNFAMLERESKKKLENSGVMSTAKRFRASLAVPGEMPAWRAVPNKTDKKRFVTRFAPAPPEAKKEVRYADIMERAQKAARRNMRRQLLTGRQRAVLREDIIAEMYQLQLQEMDKVELDWFEVPDLNILDTEIVEHGSSGTLGSTIRLQCSKAEQYAAYANTLLRAMNTAGLVIPKYTSLVQNNVNGIEDILARAAKIRGSAARQEQHEIYRFNIEVARVARWEENLLTKGGCLLSKDWAFINHIFPDRQERDLSDLGGRAINLSNPDNEVYFEPGVSKPLWEIPTDIPQDFGLSESYQAGQLSADQVYTGVLRAKEKTNTTKKPKPAPKPKLKPAPAVFVPPQQAAPPKTGAIFRVAPHPRAQEPVPRAKRGYYKSRAPRHQAPPPNANYIHDVADLIAKRDGHTHRWKRSNRIAATEFKEFDRMLICMTIARALFGGIKMAHNWRLVAIGMKSRYEPTFLRRRWDLLKSQYETRFYRMHDEFQKVFLEAYEKGETPNMDFDRVEMTDWAGLVEWFEKNVRVEGGIGGGIDGGKIVGEVKSDSVNLPADRSVLDTEFEVTERADTHEVSREAAFNLPQLKGRRDAADRLIYGIKLAPKTKGESSVQAKTWLRASVLCNVDVWTQHDPLEAAKKLSIFGTKTMDRVSAELCDASTRMIKLVKKGRKVPGRNFLWTEHANSMFKRWPNGVRGVMEVDFLPKLASDWHTFLDHFANNDGLELSPAVSDTEMLVLTQMVSLGHLKPVPQLPARNDDFDAPFPKLTKWPYTDKNYSTRGVDKGRFNNPVRYTKTADFTATHPLKPGVPIPMKPHLHVNDLGLRIPLWVDIFGNFISERWEMCLRSVLHLLVYRPGLSAKEMERYHKGMAFEFEIEIVLHWLEDTGVARRWGAGMEDEWGVWKGGWRSLEWWFLVMEAGVRTWPVTVGGMEVDSAGVKTGLADEGKGKGRAD